MNIAYTITPSSINILLHGRMRTINNTHMNFTAIKDALRAYHNGGASQAVEERIAALLDIPAFIAKVTEGKVKVGDGAVYYEDKPVGGVIAARLIDMLQKGFDVKPLARFLDRLMTNTIPTVADELYLWMEASNLPITADGCLLAFKKVNYDYKSFHDGKTDNSIGTKLPPLDESNYDTNRLRTCSSGYHFCSFGYLTHYFGNQGRVVICKIAPEDIVSIPDDYNNAKGRAKTYEIIGEVPEDEAKQFFADTPIVNAFGTYADDCCTDDPFYDWSDGYAFADSCDGDVFEEGYGGLNAADADLMGLDINYFDPETNAVTQYLLKNPSIAYEMQDWLDGVLSRDRVADFFTWNSEPQGICFWNKIYSGDATGDEFYKARFLIGHYVSIINEAVPRSNNADPASFITPDGREISADEVNKIVKAHGETSAARLLSVPIYTLHAWVAQITK